MNNVIWFPAVISREDGHWHHGERFATLRAMVQSLPPKDYARLIAWDRRRRWVGWTITRSKRGQRRMTADLKAEVRKWQAARKQQQRHRRKAGFEQVAALVFMPKFIAWLFRDGRLVEADVGDRGKISKALEDFLREQYDLPDVPGEPLPRYAAGSFGAEFSSLRDRPSGVVGLLEREGQCAWRDPPTRYLLITKRTAAIRRIAGYEFPLPLADFPPGALMEEYLLDEPLPLSTITTQRMT